MEIRSKHDLLERRFRAKITMKGGDLSMSNYQGYYPQGVYTPPQQPVYQQPIQHMFMQPQMQQPAVISGRMVSSREEALSVPVDYSSGMTVLPDLPHATIYAKVVNRETGAADVLTFKRVSEEIAAPQESRMDTLEQKVDAILQMLQSAPTGKHVKEVDANV